MRNGTFIDVSSVPEELRRQWRFTPDFRPGRELLMCFSAKNGHGYLIAGRHELHGHLIYKKIKLREFSERSVEPLVIVRFTGLSEAEIDRVESHVGELEGTRDTSCLELMRHTLKYSLGIHMVNYLPLSIFLVPYFRSIVRNGYRRGDGSVQPVELYLNRPWTLEQVQEHFRRLDRRFWHIAVLGTLIGGPILIMRRWLAQALGIALESLGQRRPRRA